MRGILTLKLDKPLTLPIHYNHILQAAILNLLSDENYSKFIHDTGFQFGKRRFKMFTFSRLEGKFSIDIERKTITYFERAYLHISTIEDKFIEYVVNNLLLEGLDIKGERIHVDKIELKSNTTNFGKIITKSPIVAYSTFELNGRKKTYYYNPKEKEFQEILANNLIKKYIAYFEKEPKNRYFEITPVSNLKESIVIYKGTVIRGWNGIFQINGFDELINIAYDTGLGAKNSQGFGCFEFI